MSKSDEAIREIAEKHFPCVGTRNDREYRKMEQDALVSSITALISEHYYPKEFLLWTHHQDYWHFDIITDMWYNDDDEPQTNEITTNELYSYWKENER